MQDPRETEINAVIADQLHLHGSPLLILHAIQTTFGHVPSTALTLIARAMNFIRAEAHGVKSLHHDVNEMTFLLNEVG